MNFLDVAHLIGLLVLSKIERVVEQESDFRNRCGAVCELVAVQKEGLEHGWSIKFFVDLDKETIGGIVRNEGSTWGKGNRPSS